MGKNWVTHAYLLADGTSLKFNQTPEKVVVKLPSSAPHPIASVVVLEIDQGSVQILVIFSNCRNSSKFALIFAQASKMA
jgi:hypothetical protein